jgi:hypothetical protein
MAGCLLRARLKDAESMTRYPEMSLFRTRMQVIDPYPIGTPWSSLDLPSRSLQSRVGVPNALAFFSLRLGGPRWYRRVY